MKNRIKIGVSTLALFVVAILSISLLAGCSDNKNSEGQPVTKYNYTGDTTTTTVAKKTYGFNETFKFDDLEITIGDGYTFDKVKNKYSEHNGETVVKLPVTVKNVSSETKGLNMFYYKIYGSHGTDIDELDSYFKNTLTYMGDLRSGAGKTAYLHFQYDGDGLYAIEFDNYSEEVTAEFTITK